MKAPIYIVHSQDDFEIPYFHSQNLFESLLEPFLPPAPTAPTSPSELNKFDWAAFNDAAEARRVRRAAVVEKSSIDGFAKVQKLVRSKEKGVGLVVYVEALYGGHDRLGLQESLLDYLKVELF